ncbi:hypothetical protein JOC94_000170 [Bacillus thermophilus]|uniref:Uncharacterized protein n=1 Tax=Siminovitchia thermophila TaxID=1245522 RepID=A0ABS2R0U7_9BACI|nr:hypothetical protein [Siminovitchia thermophila]MBM7713204.1 hypothetical protein [Siminovitchia thermophila]
MSNSFDNLTLRNTQIRFSIAMSFVMEKVALAFSIMIVTGICEKLGI